MNIFKKTRVGKTTSVILGLATAAFLSVGVFMSPTKALGVTIEELLAQIAALTAQLNELKSTSASTATADKCSFARSLTVGSKGDDVTCLQNYLKTGGYLSVNATGYFGPATKAAAAKWQAANGVVPAVGFFGSLSRAKYDSLTAVAASSASSVASSVASSAAAASSSSSVAATTAEGLTITSATQPAATLAVRSASRLPFTKVTLTAGSKDVTVTGITVERTGLANDAAFAGIVLLNEAGAQLGISKTLNSDHKAIIGDTVTIKAGTSQTFTVAGNMAADQGSYAGQVAYLSVTGVTTSATVSGLLPISGAGHTINSNLTIGTATLALSSFDPNSTALSKEIGTSGYKFAGIRATAGSSEKVRLYSIRWNQTGSAGSGDLANVKTYIDGNAYDTVVSSDGKYYTSTFGSGVIIDKGLSVDIYVQGDIVGSGAAARTVQFDIYKTTDLYMTGETYGYGVTPTASANCNAVASTATAASEFINSSVTCAASGTVGTPFFSASTVTISAGSVTSVNRAISVAAKNIAVNVPNQVLGGYEIDIKGEPISVQSQVFTVSSTTGSGAGLLTNVSLYDENGAIVAGPVDGVYLNANDQTITFTDTVTYSVGKKTYILKGKIASTIGNGGTYIVKTTPSTQWTTVTGQATGNTISLSSLSTQVVMNTMTVRGAALGISISTQPVAQNVITGSQGFTYAKLLLDASQSGEDVKFSSIPLSMTFATMVVSEVTQCQLFDGTTALNTGSNVVNPSGTTDADTTFTFDQQLTVSKETVKTLNLKCNIASSVSAGDTVSWGINSTSNPTVTGVTSGNNVSETVTAATGQTMTVTAAGSYTVASDSAVLYKVAQAGVSNVELARLRFTAGASENLELRQIAFELGNTASNSPADLINQTVTLWNGSTQIGTAQFGVGVSPDNATSTQLSPAPLITAGESVVITVKGSLTAQNINEGTPGAFLAITYDGNNVGVNGNYAVGVSSQSNISSGTVTDVTTNGLRIYRTVPTIAVTSTGGTLVNGGDLYKFVVNNPNPTKDIVLAKVSFSVATTGGSATGFLLYGDGVVAKANVTEAPLGTLSIAFDVGSQAKIVPANGSKTYILKVNSVVDTASVSETISIALLADTAFPSQLNLMNTLAGLSASNIIWSPFSTTTAIADSDTQNNLDWANGYGLPGFPSNGNFSIQTWTRSN